MAREEYGKYGAGAAGLTESCLRYVRNFEDSGFGRLVLSVKSSNVTETVRAYRLLSARTDYPLHIGVTEAGLYESALVKSSIGIGALLIDGIGDTLRVSVTGDPLQEVAAAKLILRAAGLDRNYCEIISCPTCARCTADLTAITEKINAYTANITRPLKLAVMGCAVNGPGEAKEADLGIAFGGGKGVIFRKGEIVSTVPERELYDAFIKEIDGLTKV
jgi:(E)-4-hydroxy-3-methylbut-2-enyl-diphosphate synthase